MRIVHLTPGTGSFYCGACHRDAVLVRALRERGHEAILQPLYLPLFVEEPAAWNGGPVLLGGVNLFLQQKLPILGRLPRWLAARLDSPSLLRWLARRSNMTDAAGHGAMTVSMLQGERGRLRRGIEDLARTLSGEPRPDVVALSNVMLVGAARRIREVLAVPVVCSLQGEAPFLDALPPPYREQAWDLLRERVADVDAFVAVSRWYGDLMAERLGLPPSRVHVVANGVDTEGVVPPPRAGPPASPVLGYLARMCSDKGLPTLVEAFLVLRRRGCDVRLRVAGAVLPADVELVRRLEARIAAAGERADFLPNISALEKAEFLDSLSVLSVPATYGESFGLYLLEAMARGVPVVQPRHAAFPEVLAATGGGVLCEPDDAVSLADAVEPLLRDPAQAHRLGESGRRAVEAGFSAAAMAARFEAVCRLVATSPR